MNTHATHRRNLKRRKFQRGGAALAVICALSSPLLAGGMAEPVAQPVMDPVVVAQETPAAGSSGLQNLPRIIFSLLTLLAVAS